MLDGTLREIEAGTIEAGMIVRMVQGDGTSPPFSDAVAVSASSSGVKLARPYAYSHAGGDLGGMERFEASWAGLRAQYRLVLDSRGRPMRYCAAAPVGGDE